MGIFGLGKKQYDKQIEVFIVEDSKVYAEQLAFFLETRFGKSVEVSLFPVSEVMEVKLEYNEIPDVIIMDHFLSDTYSDAEPGFDALMRMKTAYPGIKFVLYTSKSTINLTEKSSEEALYYFVQKSENAFEELAAIG